MPDGKQDNAERKQTDESLRVEREGADDGHGNNLAAVDETADVVIDRARSRADVVLAAARAKVDCRSDALAPSARPADLSRERALEDQSLRKERGEADETLQDERAEQTGFLEAEREKTNRDLAAERSRADDAVATRDEFLGIVSHDLRDMLGSIVGFAGLIAKGLSDANPTERGHAQRIERAGARMNRLIGDLLDVASIEAGVLAVTLEAGDPARVVSEAVDTFQSLASGSQITLDEEIVRPLPPAAFDAARILQVLTNLIRNAIKFTPAGGKVLVRVERAGADMRFAVSDTGVGIPAGSVESVFERYHQVAKNDRRGMGLGLYISKCIVVGHGGKIWAESKLGEGSTFTFTFPCSPSLD